MHITPKTFADITKDDVKELTEVMFPGSAVKDLTMGPDSITFVSVTKDGMADEICITEEGVDSPSLYLAAEDQRTLKQWLFAKGIDWRFRDNPFIKGHQYSDS